MTSQVTKDLKTIVAENVKAARGQKGLTQRELAEQVNAVDSLAVSRWERGKSIPNPENMVALSVALGRDASWFYTDHSGPVDSEVTA